MPMEISRAISAGGLSAALILLTGLLPPLSAAAEAPRFRAGAAAVAIDPPELPVKVLGMFTERTADRVVDPMFARCLVLDDGAARIAICIADSCMMPRDLLDEARELASRSTGIPPERMLIAATHTHSAPAAMGGLGCGPDPGYQEFLPERIARAIEAANRNLAPARIGWTSVEDREHTHCRRWIFRPDRIGEDPFGGRTVRANMHPGHRNPDAIGPSGPVDPELSIVAVQSPEGRPIALLANYSMHYYGSPMLSSDYFGRFAARIEKAIGMPGDPPFVAMMSQGTSGDLMWMDYSEEQSEIGYDAYAGEVAHAALEAYRRIEYRDRAPIVMKEGRLPLRFRIPDAARLAWARRTLEAMGDRLPQTRPEVYAREQVLLLERPQAELKPQAIRIGDLGIAAVPNEVFSITGLKIKAQSPLPRTFVIELANGAEGYIPPPEQHALGGYTTWPARTAGLEVEAEPRLVATVLDLLEEVSGKPRRPLAEVHGPYARAVLERRPAAYWRLGELAGPIAADSGGAGRHGRFEDGIALGLDGPPGEGFSGAGAINRSPHFAGGRVRAEVPGLGDAYTVELWFWNGLPSDARPVTGYLFSRGPGGAAGAPGDHLAIGGTHSHAGRLVFYNGDDKGQVLAGRTEIAPRAWHRAVLVRDRGRAAVYLDGGAEPEIAGEAAAGYPDGGAEIFIGGRSDGFAPFEGKIDEVAIFDRALTPAEFSRP